MLRESNAIQIRKRVSPARIVVWTLASIALLALGLALCWLKTENDLGLGLQKELDRRFTTAAAQIKALDDEAQSTEPTGDRDRALAGQTVVAEFLMSFRVAGYQTQHGSLPSSIQELDSTNASKQPSPPDPWGHPYRLIPEGTKRFLIVSGGPMGNTMLTEDELSALRKQPVGQSFQLHGKIIFKGGLIDGPQAKQG